MNNQNLNYDKYLSHVIQLHPKWIELTTNASHDEKESFSKLSNAEKLLHFPSDFQFEVKNLFDHQAEQTALSTRIEITVYNLKKITGKTYEELKSKLHEAFGKEFSKSYFSKLISAGELLETNPELGVVKDREKLAIIAQVGDPDVIAEIARENNLASMSRPATRKLVDELLGKPSSKIEGKLEEKVHAPQSSSYQLVKAEVYQIVSKLSEEQLNEAKLFLEELSTRPTRDKPVKLVSSDTKKVEAA